jgi:acetate CoA/acetoacetate CoA-transferase beta subunit
MDKQRAKDIIAHRCAQELKDGYVVNLGIGIPTQCARYFPKGVDIILHAELGLVGQGAAPTPEEADPMHLVDASGAPASVIPGGVIVDSATNFGLIRGGHVDACVLGALEADSEGSFGNWLIPGKKMTGMGGAMDLVNGAKTVILAMTHTQGDSPKIVEKCTLPLTGYRVVNRIVTELCVLDVTETGLLLREYNPELGDPAEATAYIQARTGAPLQVAPDLGPMALPD